MKGFKNIKIVFLFAVLSAVTLFTACGLGKKELTEKDAKEYVEACFKAALAGDVDDYVKLTGESKEEVEKQYQDSLDSLKEQMSSVAGTDGDFAGDFADACKELLASTKYEVGEAKKDEDGNFTVEVKAYPSDVMTVYFNKVAQSAGGTDMGDALVGSLTEAIKEQSFGEAVSYQVGVTKGTDGKYTIESDDVNEVTVGLFAEMDSMLKPSGKVFDNPYLNWTRVEWNAASEDEKTQCTLAVLQYMLGYSDEEMAMIDLENADVQTSIQQMKDGINMTYSAAVEISIGDYADLVKEMGALE